MAVELNYGPINPDLLEPAKIGIIGYGIVGQALAFGFNQTSGGKDSILFYDKFKPSSPFEHVINQSEYVFVTLPTPMKRDESGIDLSIVDQSVDQITPLTDHTGKIVIIKSTLTPGTTRRYSAQHPNSLWAFNPEFLTEANYLNDFLHAERTIIGTDNDHVFRRLASLFLTRFPHTKLEHTDPTSAELVKSAANFFLATKVTFANVLFDLCQSLGINYEGVRDMVASDPRIGPSHLKVTGQRGFGGKCFPKDLISLRGEYTARGLDTTLFDSVWAYNNNIRKVRDWEEIPGAIEGNNQFHPTQ